MGIKGKIYLRKRKTVLFKDCSELTVWRYIQSQYKNELQYLVKSGPVPAKEVLSAHLDKISDEWNALRGESDNATVRFDTISYKEELELKCKFGIMIIDRIQTRLNEGLLDSKKLEMLVSELKNWGFHIDREVPIIQVLEECFSEINAYQSTIEVLHGQLYPENQAEEDIDGTTAEMSFTTTLLSYQRVLKIDTINPKKTTLMKMAVLEKEFHKTIKLSTTNKSE